MARARVSTPPKRLNRDSSRLVMLSLALHNSGSRVEDRFWETELATLLNKLMRTGNDAALDAALDHLSTTNIGGYEVLIEHYFSQSQLNCFGFGDLHSFIICFLFFYNNSCLEKFCEHA